MKINVHRELEYLAENIYTNGGIAYLVGGAVIDLLQGRNPKDYDVEVFNISIEKLEEVLNKYGKTNLSGSKFGVLRFKGIEIEVEFSIPRKENKIGVKHKDFDITLVPDMDIQEAASRRDFTINAIYYNILSQEIVDPFDGKTHLIKSELKLINTRSFCEDPLRVFRGMQLLSRKVEDCTLDTKIYCRDMVYQCKNLSGESIRQEFNKMLLLGGKPSRGIKFLDEIEFLGYFYPEIHNLKYVEQNPDYHAEGNAFIHSMLVLDEAAKCREKIPEKWRLAFMYAALLHDVGKFVTTKRRKDGRIQHLRHDKAGKEIAETFLQKLNAPQKLIYQVKEIVSLHMMGQWLLNNTKRLTWAKAHNRVPLNIMAYFVRCDRNGSISDSDERNGDNYFIEIRQKWAMLGCPLKEKIPPILTGKHLIKKGKEPGVKFTINIFRKEHKWHYILYLMIIKKDVVIKKSISQL